MAVTTPTTVDSAIPEVWARGILRRTKASGFWGRFVGSEGSGAPIIQKSELLNKPGDLIHFQITDPLAGAGVTGDTAQLIGNEEALSTSEMKASPLLYRHAVRINRRANKKSIIELRSEAGFRLEEWGKDKMDKLRFAQFVGTAMPAPLAGEAYTPNFYGPNAHATAATIVLADTLSVKAIQEIKLKLVNQLAKPLDADGFPYYVLVTHPNATFQLKQEARYESWVRDAGLRGDSNPFFRGALAVVDGVIIYEHVNVGRASNGTVQVATGLAFGAEAFVEALDENVHSEEQSFDYGLEYGVSYEFAVQPRRALELQSVQVFTAAP